MKRMSPAVQIPFKLLRLELFARRSPWRLYKLTVVVAQLAALNSRANLKAVLKLSLRARVVKILLLVEAVALAEAVTQEDLEKV